MLRKVGIAFMVLVVMLLSANEARAAEPDQWIDVEVGPGTSRSENVGCGFDLILPTTTLLETRLFLNYVHVSKSEWVKMNKETVWEKKEEWLWQCDGVDPAERFYVIIKVPLGGRGGGGGHEKPRWMSVSDVDLDADTDNNCEHKDSPPDPVTHRPPDETREEDGCEFADTVYDAWGGLIIGFNDDNDAGYSCRDYEFGCNYGVDEDVLDAILKINPMKKGTFYIHARDSQDLLYPLRIYDGNNEPICSGRVEESEKPFLQPLRVETGGGEEAVGLIKGVASGYIEASFWPDPYAGAFLWDDKGKERIPDIWCGEFSEDIIRFLILRTDLDVNSDNSDPPPGIEILNLDSSGEDFFEDTNPGAPWPYEFGMLVGVNDDDDDEEGGYDNGWNGKDYEDPEVAWDGPDAETIQGEGPGEDIEDLKDGRLRAIGLKTFQLCFVNAFDPVIAIAKTNSEGGAVRLFARIQEETEWGHVGTFIAKGDSYDCVGSRMLWDMLTNPDKKDVELKIEGLKPGEVKLQVKLTLNGNVKIHEDRVKVTVSGVTLTPYKRDGTTAVTKKTDPGAFVAYNNDDDDADGGGTQMDKDDNDIQKESIPVEDDTIKVHCGFIGFFDSLQTGKVVLKRENTKIRLWKNRHKGGADQEIVFDQADDKEKVYDLSVTDQRSAFLNDIKGKDLWLEGYEASGALRDTALTLIYRDADNTDLCDDTAKVTVVDSALTFYKRDGTTEVTMDKEEEPGAYVAMNDDDDDLDEVLDNADSNGVAGEDDLVKVHFGFGSLFDGLQTGKVVLRRKNTKVRLWKQSTKGTDQEIVFDQADDTEKAYDLSNADQQTAFANDIKDHDRRVEGYEASDTLMDAGLTLLYRDVADAAVCEDPVNVTVVDVELDIADVDDAHEMSKGRFLALNDDDDDVNHTEDKSESGPITGEDNLVKITLAVLKPNGLAGNVTLKANAGGTKIQVWNAATKGGTAVALPATYSVTNDLPKELYVEGIAASGSVRDVELAVEYIAQGDTFDDKVKATIVDVASVAVEASDTDTYKIASVLLANQVPDDHFVTIMGLAGDITLTATITPNIDEAKAYITWTNMTQDATDKLKATKTRAAVGKFPATVNVAGASAHRLANWVVWSTAATSARAVNETVDANVTSISGGYDVTHTIQPAAIVTDADRPDLTGANAVDPPNVPAGDNGVYQQGVDLSGGANLKWDSSRQVRQKLVNPNNINFAPLHPIALYTTYPNYPSDDVCGNDDAWAGDEDNDPYNAPAQGSLVGRDNPRRRPFHSEGNLGDTFEIRIHMRGFARLQLGTKWYRISDWCLWRAHLLFKKQNESEAQWGLDFNGDGDLLDTVPVWRDNGSTIATDNNGF